MKYRIKTDGEFFTLQTKGWFFWWTESHYCDYRSHRRFRSEADADMCAKDEYGRKADRVRSWRIV